MKRFLLVLGMLILTFPAFAQKKNVLDNCNGDFKKEIQALYDYAQQLCSSSTFSASEAIKSGNASWELKSGAYYRHKKSKSNIRSVKILSNRRGGSILCASYSVSDHSRVCSALRSILGEPYYSEKSSDGRENAKWKTPGGLSVMVYPSSDGYGMVSSTELSFE